MNLEFRPYQNLTLCESLEILALRNQEHIRKNMYNQAVIAKDDHLKWVGSLCDRMDCRYWAILKDGVIVGALDITHLSEDGRRAEWGFYIGKDHPGLGAIVETAALDYFFDVMGIEVLTATVQDDNLLVYKLHVEKFGFKEDPSVSQILNGRCYRGISLTAEGWVARKGRMHRIIEKMLSGGSLTWS